MKYLLIICILFWNLTGIVVAAPEKSDVLELLEGRCLLYTSPSPRDGLLSRMPSSA